MLTVTDREAIRRAYYREQKSIRAIARELHHSRDTVKAALTDAAPAQYTLSQPRAAPVLGPYQERIQELLAANEQLPRKQRYTGNKIFELICAEGYTGAASTVRGYLSQLRRTHRQQRPVYLPLAFAPGEAAQVDWGEARRHPRGSPANGAGVCDVVVLFAALVRDGLSHATPRSLFHGPCARVRFLSRCPAHPDLR